MLKISGGIIVIIISFLYGQSLKRSIVDKIEITNELIKGLRALKEEIRYSPDYLENSILKINEFCGEKTLFFKKVYDGLKRGLSSDESWQNAADELKELDLRMFSCIKELGSVIGKSDREGQENLLTSTILKLESIEGDQQTELLKKGALYPKFGAVFGVLVTIILF